MDECEVCGQQGAGYTDNGELLCGDCLFEAIAQAEYMEYTEEEDDDG